MGVNSLPKTVTRQRRDCDLNPGPSVPESSTLTTRLPSHQRYLQMSMLSSNKTLETECYSEISTDCIFYVLLLCCLHGILLFIFYIVNVMFSCTCIARAFVIRLLKYALTYITYLF